MSTWFPNIKRSIQFKAVLEDDMIILSQNVTLGTFVGCHTYNGVLSVKLNMH